MIYASPAVTAVINALSRQPKGKKTARALMGSRFVSFPDDISDKQWRRRTSESIRDGATNPLKLGAWKKFVFSICGGKIDSPKLLFARQESRLMVNVGGSVFENGGLCLDLSGIPFIPGSAIKGCARRTAIAALKNFGNSFSNGTQENDPFALDENPLTSSSGSFASLDEFLFTIALTFGWSDLEWKGREDFDSPEKWQEKRSDFAWACGDSWQHVRFTVATQLCTYLQIEPKDGKSPWKSLSTFAGTITSFPAYPWEKDPGIELEIVTPHHTKYYQGDDPAFISAPDTEEPIPNTFPAVAPGSSWVFLLDDNGRALPEHLAHAQGWLATGLGFFGIGAKTNAGYGSFDASEEFDRSFKQAMLDQQLIEHFANKYRSFTEWGFEKKEEAILALLDQQRECILWKSIDPQSFAPVESFAISIEIQLA